MTLKQKREIVRRFMTAEWKDVADEFLFDSTATNGLLLVLRDFLNGKFTLDPKKRKRGGR